MTNAPVLDLPLLASLDRRLADSPSLTITLDAVPYAVSDLDRLARRLAAALSERVRPGDRVVVMARNGRLAMLSWWAAALCRAYLVPLNTSNRGPVLEHQIHDSEPVLLLAEREFAPVLAEPLRALGLSLPVIWDGPGDEEAVEATPGRDHLDLDQVLAAHAPQVTTPDLDVYDTSHLIYTAGTTGPSKACMVSHGYVANIARQMRTNHERTPGDILWTPLPLFHLAAVGHTVASLQLGAGLDLATRFSVTGFWGEILRSGASMAGLMGSMLPMIANAPQTPDAVRAHGRLRMVSGSPVTAELSRTWQERFGVERVGAGAYGMTEAGLLTATPPGRYRPGTAGTVTDSFEVRIVDERDEPVPVGTVGEIVCRPTRPGIMFNGYWRQPEKTLEVFRGLWFHCGDYGRFDEDGYLHFVDRGKDYLRRGGENISSYEIEGVIAQHPTVGEVAVHAVPSQLNEDDLKVTVVPKPGTEVDPAELFEWISPRVPRYAVPSFVEVRSELPKNSLGRILKRTLREEGVTPSTWTAPSPRSRS